MWFNVVVLGFAPIQEIKRRSTYITDGAPAPSSKCLAWNWGRGWISIWQTGAGTLDHRLPRARHKDCTKRLAGEKHIQSSNMLLKKLCCCSRSMDQKGFGHSSCPFFSFYVFLCQTLEAPLPASRSKAFLSCRPAAEWSSAQAQCPSAPKNPHSSPHDQPGHCRCWDVPLENPWPSTNLKTHHWIIQIYGGLGQHCSMVHSKSEETQSSTWPENVGGRSSLFHFAAAFVQKTGQFALATLIGVAVYRGFQFPAVTCHSGSSLHISCAMLWRTVSLHDDSCPLPGWSWLTRL